MKAHARVLKAWPHGARLRLRYGAALLLSLYISCGWPHQAHSRCRTMVPHPVLGDAKKKKKKQKEKREREHVFGVAGPKACRDSS